MAMIDATPHGILRKVRQVRAEVVPYLRNVALESGLMAGQTEYAKFIILGRSRVGSNFLRGLLNSHSQVTVFGELFQNKEEIGWALPGYYQSKRLSQLHCAAPVDFLERKVFRSFPGHVRAVGFKIFYYHAQDEAWKPVWEYLQSLPDLKVVHMKRRNILKTHLSRRRAVKTDRWVNTNGSSEPQRSITLDYKECLDDFIRTRAWEEAYDAYFAGNDMIEVMYEDLAADYQREATRLQNFLGVEFEAVQPETYKQAKRPLSEAIANYGELKERFQQTPWSPFFED